MLQTLLLLAHAIVAVVLVILVLLQRSDGGMGALGGGVNAMFAGRKSANPLSRATAIMAALFMGLSLLLSVQFMGAGRSSSVVDEPLPAGAATTSAAPADENGEETPGAPAAPGNPDLRLEDLMPPVPTE